MSEKNHINKLINEKSPYLLQHARNPVDWYPWGDAAFEKARQEDKPVFLSIGYSTCHWCHVMERESFEDDEVAAILNDAFVAVKVDREERPDIDAVYMTVCQALTGQGGWPMTVMLTPEKKPFFAGTYFPKESRFGMNGIVEILLTVKDLWKNKREKLERMGTEIQKNITSGKQRKVGELTRRAVTNAFEMFRDSFDGAFGGFGHAPKFPTPHNLLFLLRYAVLEGNKKALDMVEMTLRQMYRGGIFDHIGYGFSRYSTDNKWLVPHFEKMLYDNALLTLAYLEAYQVTHKKFYRSVADKILLYVQRELAAPGGGFYSAQDADSDGAEGRYYVLTPDDVLAVLGHDDGDYFCRYFDITEKGNFEHASIPNLIENKAYDKPDDRIDALLPALRTFRLSRTTLFKDDKILTSWNALMIAAFAKAYQVTGNASYRESAESAAAFIIEKLTTPDGHLMVRYRDNDAAGTGFFDDYVFFAFAMLMLYDATFDVTHLEEAVKTAEMMCGLFEDTAEGGFFLYGDDAEELILRPKETFDGAIPSGNAVAAYVLSRLAALTGEAAWQARADRQAAFLAAAIQEYPLGHSFGLMAALFALYPTTEVICTMRSPDDAEQLREALADAFVPNTTLLVKTQENARRLNAIVPSVKDYPLSDETLFYICQNKSCQAPFTGVTTLARRLTEQTVAQ
ncbi:thioredoxin domain-containing protein [Oscillospiraceae bacterium WX1]